MPFYICIIQSVSVVLFCFVLFCFVIFSPSCISRGHNWDIIPASHHKIMKPLVFSEFRFRFTKFGPLIYYSISLKEIKARNRKDNL